MTTIGGVNKIVSNKNIPVKSTRVIGRAQLPTALHNFLLRSFKLPALLRKVDTTNEDVASHRDNMDVSSLIFLVKRWTISSMACHMKDILVKI